MTQETKTKKVRITLSALTRVEYTEVLEVSADLTAADLACLVDQRYEEVNGDEYVGDPEYWERSASCGWEMADPAEVADARVTLNEEGYVEVTGI